MKINKKYSIFAKDICQSLIKCVLIHVTRIATDFRRQEIQQDPKKILEKTRENQILVKNVGIQNVK